MAGTDDDPLRIGGIARPTGAGGVEPTEAATAADRVDAAPELGGPDATAGVAQALAAGAIDGDAALRALVEHAATSVLGPGADPAAIAAVRAEVEALLAGDPTLATLLRR